MRKSQERERVIIKLVKFKCRENGCDEISQPFYVENEFEFQLKQPN